MVQHVCDVRIVGETRQGGRFFPAENDRGANTGVKRDKRDAVFILLEDWPHHTELQHVECNQEESGVGGGGGSVWGVGGIHHVVRISHPERATSRCRGNVPHSRCAIVVINDGARTISGYMQQQSFLVVLARF